MTIVTNGDVYTVERIYLRPQIIDYLNIKFPEYSNSKYLPIVKGLLLKIERKMICISELLRMIHTDQYQYLKTRIILIYLFAYIQHNITYKLVASRNTQRRL